MSFKSVLKKIGKVASIAAPIVAAPFTGGASLALIGAGAGAANAALNGGGVKGALLGAGLGGVTAGLGGGAAKGAASTVAKQGIKSAATSALKKPSTYLNALKMVGGGGGTMDRVGNVAGMVGPTLTGLAAGKQKGREAENAANASKADFLLRERQGNENTLENRAGLDLRQRQFAQDSQNNAYANALRSAVAKNIQDVSIGGVPKGVPVINFSGGLRPSAMGPEGRAAAGLMNQKAMTSLMDGEKFDALPGIERTAAPEYAKPGGLENTLGIGATIANGIGGYQAGQQQQTMQQKILAAIEALNQPRQRTTEAPPMLDPNADDGQ